jgi:CubicO group peptidase (beta-lactamase class C family)
MRVRPALLLPLLLSTCTPEAEPAAGGPSSAPQLAPATSPAGAPPVPRSSEPDPDALQRLLDRARATRSDAVALRFDGRLVLSETFGRAPEPLPCMSMTKSVVSLAIGLLLDAGLIASIDTPVARFFPEWASEPKSTITIRHVLAHTSGLATSVDTKAIYASPDIVAHALGAHVVAPPGTTFAYNNRAVNLLAGVVARAAGQRLDEFVAERLFTPLGIDHFAWAKDPAGNPHAMAGLRLCASDLTKIGQLMLDGGRHGGRQIVSAAWVAECTRPSQTIEPRCGLLWWLVPETEALRIDAGLVADWRNASMDSDRLARLTPLVGRTLVSEEFDAAIAAALGGPAAQREWRSALRNAGLPEGRAVLGPSIGFAARGFLGQQLVVLPHRRIVAVRQIASAHRTPDDEFADFVDCVRAL